jgi:hypothetical protein
MPPAALAGMDDQLVTKREKTQIMPDADCFDNVESDRAAGRTGQNGKSFGSSGTIV